MINKSRIEIQKSDLLRRVWFWNISWKINIIILSFFAFLFWKKFFMNGSMSSTTFMNCEAFKNFLDLLIFSNSLDKVSILDQMPVFSNTDVSCNFKHLRSEVLKKRCHGNSWSEGESLAQSALFHKSGKSSDREN